MLSKNNTKLRVKGIGNIKLKYISFGDTKDLLQILHKKQISDKRCVQKIIFNQLIKPKLGFGKFNKIPDQDLIKISQAFIKKERHVFQYYKNTGNFFQDFRLSLEAYEKKSLERLRLQFEPIISSTQKVIEAFSKDYSSIIQPTLYVGSYIQELSQGFMRVAKQFQDVQVGIAKSLKPIIETTNILAESLKPQIDFWQKWAKQNKRLFDSVRNLVSAQEREFLFRNGWIFTPYLKGKSVENDLLTTDLFKKTNAEINSIYEDFFSKDNYKELELMIISWNNKRLFKPRMRIFVNCLKILRTFRLRGKNVQRLNPSTIILPVLIAQIDGIGLLYAKDSGLFLDRTQLKDSAGQTFNKWCAWMWKLPCGDTSEVYFLRMLEDFLFATAFPVGQIKRKNKLREQPENIRPFLKYNRNKIMHGEDLRYGTIDNLLRTFLALDFLAHLT